MKIETLNKMIEEDFEDFENEQKRHKNLKMFVNFERFSFNFEERNISIGTPKFKKKLKTSTYIKNNNKKGLF